jgi:hypothetical protein
LIEQGYLLVVGYPVIFFILRSMATMHLGGGVVVVCYDTPELHFIIGVAFNAIYGMHQTSMNLKT